MILVDTSVWVEHFKRTSSSLISALESGQVGCHPFVIGELLLGGLPQSSEAANDLYRLYLFDVATEFEVARFIEQRRLSNSGIGYVDAHLLASCLISGGELMTHDRHLFKVATRLGISYCG